MPTPRICIVGSANMDLVSYAPRLPKLGETLPASRFTTGFGGKGANQGVMAARLGGATTMVAKVGRDAFGRQIIDNFTQQGIDTTYVLSTDDAATGVAPIWVEQSSGNNAILVALGANDLLSPADIEHARPAIQGAHVLVCQWECPVETTLAALRWARSAGVFTIFNPAPARGGLPPEIYALVDILCPNEDETRSLTGIVIDDEQKAVEAGQALLARGPRHVILTLGTRGCLWLSANIQHFLPAQSVHAVDTTGAGDAFVGSLAYFLGAGVAFEEAIRRATFVAGVSIQSPGAQSSYPLRAALPPQLFEEM